MLRIRIYVQLNAALGCKLLVFRVIPSLYLVNAEQRKLRNCLMYGTDNIESAFVIIQIRELTGSVY